MRYRIARAGKEIGSYDAGSIAKALASGELLATDHFWDGAQWRLLSGMPPSPSPSVPPQAVSGSIADRDLRIRMAPVHLLNAFIAFAIFTVVVIGGGGFYFVAEALSELRTTNVQVKEGLAELRAQTRELRQLNSAEWEYTSFRVLTTQVSDRNGSEAFKYSSINDVKLDGALKEAGLAGWQVVSVALEMETAWPNFGKEDYVTGLQPNIRPQSLLVILRRPKR